MRISPTIELLGVATVRGGFAVFGCEARNVVW